MEAVARSGRCLQGFALLRSKNSALTNFTGMAVMKKPRTESISRKTADAMWESLLKDGRICMTPEEVHRQLGDEGFRNTLDLPINKRMRLLGPYPRGMNLHATNLPYEYPPGAFTKKAYAALHKYGKPLPANLHLVDDPNVEEIFLSADAVASSSYIVIENLPSLRRISISPDIETGDYPVRNELLSLVGSGDDDGLKWLVCKDLPSLESIDVEGGLIWLHLQNVPRLRTLDLAKASKLFFLKINHAPALSELRIEGCIKLGEVQGLGFVQMHKLGVNEAIDNMQSSISRFDGVIYENMTISDVNFTMDSINRAWESSVRQGLLVCPDDVYTCNRVPGHDKWSFYVLDPLAGTYTHGTGMTPIFKIVERWFDSDLDELNERDWGATSPEECLREALSAANLPI